MLPRCNGRAPGPDQLAEMTGQANLLRCKLGNPSRRTRPIDAGIFSWNGGTVARLAAAAYQNRYLSKCMLDTTLLCILADALEETGATDPLILGHLRDRASITVASVWWTG
jgi:hypothetical protein